MNELEKKKRKFTGSLLFGSAVESLPSAVTVRQIGTGHEDLGPRMEVPDGVEGIAVGSALDLFAEDVEILVDGQRVVGVVRRHEVGHRTRRDTQRTTDCQSSSNSSVFYHQISIQSKIISSI